MSCSMNWDIEKYRDDHECEDHWQLRKAFMERWKSDYTEERLVCLARVFANIEFMGCRYPPEVMQEVSRLTQEVAKSYRNIKKTKLQRTFVSASDAAEDRAKGIKRKGGVVIDESPKKSKIEFVRQGQILNSDQDNDVIIIEDVTESSSVLRLDKKFERIQPATEKPQIEKKSAETTDANDYITDMLQLDCLDVRQFRESMFNTPFGKLVLIIRPWSSKMQNISTSCQVCGVNLTSTTENGCFSLFINGKLVAQATGETKNEAKSIVETMTWDKLRKEVVSVLIKEQILSQNDTCISVSEVTGGGRSQPDAFGTKIESSVAMKMMKMMGWKGGGLGAEAQGIAEPIKPNMQLVHRAGLGSQEADLVNLRRTAVALMRRYIASDTFDLDLVFSNEFSKEERALLHQCAARAGLASRSYGGDKDRFLVVKKKMEPFSLVRAVVEKGGNTPRYQVFIPHSTVSR